ncbi:MAG: hypothetical protein ACXAAH_05510 [Promethearchaeota archaeon]|jgi:hypothetical protein
MIKSLSKLFSDLELSWIDSSSEIATSSAYTQILSLFPNLRIIFQDGRKNDPEEFQRTIRHIFRSFKIFFLIKNGKFSHETISNESLNILRKKILNQYSQNPLILPIILMYHDIGRLENKKEHPYQSYSLISKQDMLQPFELTEVDKLLIKKVIQYHLLFATIYTGESTFYGIYSLINDSEFNKIGYSKQNIDKFIDLLEIFTYIDILGYAYARIYDHYLTYYDKINFKLKNILNIWSDKKSVLKLALEYSQQWLEWRIAGALRIFQYVNTRPYLNEDFYFDKIRESVNKDVEKIADVGNWNKIKEHLLPETFKIQMKYGLAILMLLAFGKFFRGPIEENEKISDNLTIFWILLSKEISNRSPLKNQFLWNVHFIGLPNWWKWDRKFRKELNYHTLEYIIKNASQKFDKKRKEFNLYLDFKSVFHLD